MRSLARLTMYIGKESRTKEAEEDELTFHYLMDDTSGWVSVGVSASSHKLQALQLFSAVATHDCIAEQKNCFLIGK